MTIKHTFPAGQYYIGDPCYAIRDNNWISTLKETGYFGLRTSADENNGDPITNWDDGVFYYNGHACFAGGTAYGDGVYGDNFDGSYGVDAGLLSIMPVEAIDEKPERWLCEYRTFEKDFEVWESGGVFHFGKVRIDTN